MHPRGDARVVERAAPVLRGLAFAGGVRAVLHYSDIEPWLLYKVGARQQRQIIGRLPLGVESVASARISSSRAMTASSRCSCRHRKKCPASPRAAASSGRIWRPSTCITWRSVSLPSLGPKISLMRRSVHQVQRNNGEGARLCAIPEHGGRNTESARCSCRPSPGPQRRCAPAGGGGCNRCRT